MQVSAFSIPTATPESDGTLGWDSTVLVVVKIEAGNKAGLGFTYADSATAKLISDKLAGVILGASALAVKGCWNSMAAAIRNLGRPGICSMAIAAVDNALWDLKARILDLPLVLLLGQVRSGIPVYGSGGFTSYSIPELQKQLGDWDARGIGSVKMKIGCDPENDVNRVGYAREVIGQNTGLFFMPTAHIHVNKPLPWHSRWKSLAFRGLKNLLLALGRIQK